MLLGSKILVNKLGGSALDVRQLTRLGTVWTHVEIILIFLCLKSIYMPHFPLLGILGNFAKHVLESVRKNCLLQVYKRFLKRVHIEHVREFLSLLITFKQSLNVQPSVLV